VKHRPASLVTLAYLVLTLPLLIVRSPQPAIVPLLHVAAIGLVAWSLLPATTRPEGTRPLPADWLPLLLMPFLYAELPYLIGASAVLRDPLVQTWEAALFGGQPARALAARWPGATLSELLHLGYLLYYPIVYVPPLMLYFAGRREEFRRTVFAVMLTYVVCFLVFALFPVEGPRYAWGAPPSVPAGPIRSLTLAVLERGSSRGTAFPSSHAAVASAQAILALRYQRGLGVGVAVMSALLMIGAVYGGFHYAVDVLAGAVVGAAIGSATVVPRPARVA
jgi:membrane-associated phospholipid phosphatase